MNSRDKEIEVEIDSQYMKDLIDLVLKVGNDNNVNPHEFVIALLEASYIICDVEKIDLYNLFSILLKENERSKYLH